MLQVAQQVVQLGIAALSVDEWLQVLLDENKIVLLHLHLLLNSGASRGIDCEDMESTTWVNSMCRGDGG